MVKTTTTVVLALALLGSSAYAAQGSQNGAPFQALTELIEANEVRITDNANLIAANSTAIATNATSITNLEVQAAQTAIALAALESRVTSNETDIASIYDALANVYGDIDALNVNINNLTINVRASINALNIDIDIIKDTISTLSTSLDALRDGVSDAVAELDNAIATNSGDIAVLSAVVTSMDAKLTLTCANILSLNARVDSAQRSIDSQSDALLVIDAKITNIYASIPSLSDIYYLATSHPSGNIGYVGNKIHLMKGTFKDGLLSSVELIKTLGTFISQPTLYSISYSTVDIPVYGHNTNDLYKGTEYEGLSERAMYISHSLQELSVKVNEASLNGECFKYASNYAGSLDNYNSFWTLFCPSNDLDDAITAP